MVKFAMHIVNGFVLSGSGLFFDLREFMIIKLPTLKRHALSYKAGLI